MQFYFLVGILVFLMIFSIGLLVYLNYKDDIKKG